MPSMRRCALLARRGAREQEDLLRLLRLVFQTFLPFTMKRSPSRWAKVRMREVSVPASSSVTPNETCSSPVAVGGRYFCFIASEPWWITGPMPKIERCSVEAAFIAPALPATARSSAPACGHAEARAAVLLGDQHAHPAGGGEGVVELPGELLLVVVLEPVVVVEGLAASLPASALMLW